MPNPQITNLRTARVEAAARAMAEWDGLDFDASETKFVEASGVFKNTYRDGALGALNAADAVVTVEMIAQVIRRVDGERNLGAGEIAEAVHRLYTGKEQP